MEKDRSLYPMENVPMVRRMVIAALCRGEPFFADLTLFERSSNLRDHLTPHSRRSKTNEGDPPGKDHRASICFHQRPLLFFSLLISSSAFHGESFARFSSTTRKESTPCASDGVCIGSCFLFASIRGEHVIKRINRE